MATIKSSLQDNQRERGKGDVPPELHPDSILQENEVQESHSQGSTVGNDHDDPNVHVGQVSFQQEYKRRSGGSYFR